MRSDVCLCGKPAGRMRREKTEGGEREKRGGRGRTGEGGGEGQQQQEKEGGEE